jgi:hypothetical protein
MPLKLKSKALNIANKLGYCEYFSDYLHGFLFVIAGHLANDGSAGIADDRVPVVIIGHGDRDA